jgi:hypothetical protein
MRQRGVSFLAVVAAGVIALGVASEASASHFRFGHNTWRLLSGTTVEFTSTQAWRAATLPGSELPIDFGDGSGVGIGPITTIGTFMDLAGEFYTIVQYKVQHTYPNQGPFTAFLASCCRIYSLINASGASERVETVVDLTGGNTGSPVGSIPVILQMTQGVVNNIPIPIADPDGDIFTCRMATFAESEIPSVASAGIHTLSVSPGCVLTWNTLSTTVGEKYAVQVAIEATHAGSTSRVALDFIIEIVGGTGNQPPACSGTSGLNVVNVGQPFAGNFTGTDADGDNLTLSHLGLPPGATLTPPSGTTQAEPFNSTFNWTPQPSDAGTSYAVTIIYQDPGGLQGVCSFSINVPLVVTDCGNNIQESGEQCDGTDDDACPGACVPADQPNECTCGAAPGCSPPNCDDQNPCTDDSCGSAGGAFVCNNTPNTAPCDDLDPCTVGDVCGGGACTPGPSPCDDDNPCTDDSCGSAGGGFVCDNTPNTAPCDDGEDCTVGDVCDGGSCVPGPVVDVLGCNDHYKCYKVTNEPFAQRPVTLVDQFGTTSATVIRPTRFCNPADKNSGGILDPTAHLMCYQLRESGFARRTVVVRNQFGDQTVTVVKPETLCNPAEKNGVPFGNANGASLDHFKCYRIRAKGFTTRTVTLTDQFETRTDTVLKPRLLCNPVDKNGEGIPNPALHLTCYTLKAAPFTPQPVVVEDQFGAQSGQPFAGECSRRAQICLPSLKNPQ